MNLERFHAAQASPTAGYSTALAEIHGGEKRSHWIWYIFPQLAELGRSATAQAYGIRDLAEACAYLQDATLGRRYLEITLAAAAKLDSGSSLEALMGGSTDALKFVSSLTLFEAAARHLLPTKPLTATLVPAVWIGELHTLSGHIFESLAARGTSRCQFTVERCSGS